MTRSSTIAVTATPEATDLWALGYLFSCDWGDDVVVRTSFSTTIENARSASEQRRGLRGSPQRTVLFSVLAYNPEQINSLESMMIRGAKARSLVPLISDMAYLTSTASAAATTINVTTTDRRLFAGTRAVIFEPTSDAMISTWEVVQVDSVSSSTIGISSGLVNSYAARAVIAPLIEAHLSYSVQGDVYTDYVARVSIEAREVVGPTALPAFEDIGDTPSDFTDHDSIPILDIPVNYSGNFSWGVSRQGALLASGIGAIEEVVGSRGARNYSLPFSGMTRAESFRMVRFFESRGGRLHPFWVFSPVTNYKALSVEGSGDGLVLDATALEVDWSLRPYIGIEYRDGTRDVREVDSVVRAAGEDTVLFDTTIPGLDLADVLRVCVVSKARFSSDEFSEQWTTDGIMVGSLDIIEVLEEKDITVSDITKLETTDLEQQGYTAGQCVEGDEQPVPSRYRCGSLRIAQPDGAAEQNAPRLYFPSTGQAALFGSVTGLGTGGTWTQNDGSPGGGYDGVWTWNFHELDNPLASPYGSLNVRVTEEGDLHASVVLFGGFGFGDSEGPNSGGSKNITGQATCTEGTLRGTFFLTGYGTASALGDIIITLG